MFGPSPTIRIEVEQNTVFLHPSADASVIPSDDADQIVRGAVVLSLPQPKKLSSLTVVFRGDQSYNGGPGYPYEEEHVLFKELEIGLQDEMLPVGESVYEFTFIVPSNTPEQQRCSYGRTVYYRTFASDIKSKIVPIWVLGNPAPPGEFPEFSELLTSYQEPLG
ncbi:Arrestin-like, N-terminal and Immunoglobulin E-set domain protein, partial [Pseudohyphozyma bogoriensis]